mgnify:CR=1 FL=1
MKKYNIQNYVRYKDDVKRSMPVDKPYVEYNRNELIVKFMPLVENLARKFPTSQQASGILSINMPVPFTLGIFSCHNKLTTVV